MVAGHSRRPGLKKKVSGGSCPGGPPFWSESPEKSSCKKKCGTGNPHFENIQSSGKLWGRCPERAHGLSFFPRMPCGNLWYVTPLLQPVELLRLFVSLSIND